MVLLRSSQNRTPIDGAIPPPRGGAECAVVAPRSVLLSIGKRGMRLVGRIAMYDRAAAKARRS